MQECLFCNIVTRKIPANIVYQDDSVLAFNDIHPQAPHHVLIIPHKHIATLNDASVEDKALLGHMMYIAPHIAKQLNIATDGYRVVMNCNRDAGQAVYHIHLHILGGRSLSWPPG